MNVKEYISSGIIESYVLGLVSEQERQEFEALCAQHPEIAAARNAFELTLEENLLADAMPLAPSLRQTITDRITSLSVEPASEVEEEQRTPVRSIGAWKWLAAASLILMAGAAYWGYSSDKKYHAALADNQQLRSQLDQSTAQLSEVRHEASMMQSPGVKMAALKGTGNAPSALATIYWDTASTSKDVYLMVNNLPQPASDKQYQLWALLNGKPINLGVFDMQVQQKPLLVKMQNVQNAQAFAITLEPKGGSPAPTMDSMYVMGSL